jgi:hypothetical protein
MLIITFTDTPFITYAFLFTMVSCPYLSFFTPILFYLRIYIYIHTSRLPSVVIHRTEGKSCLYLFPIMLLTVTYCYSYLFTIGVYCVVVISLSRYSSY